MLFQMIPSHRSLLGALEASRQAGCEAAGKLQRDRKAVGDSLVVGPSLSKLLQLLFQCVGPCLSIGQIWFNRNHFVSYHEGV